MYLVWDWNGTLLDDAALCVEVMNKMLGKRGLPPLQGLAHYRELFTFPVKEYYRRAGLDLEREPFSALALEYITPYNQAALECGLCRGAKEALAWLQSRGVEQLIASASQEDALRAQVERQGIAGYFEALLGVKDSYGSGKEGVALAYLESRKAEPRQVWFVGDTVHDWEVARSLGCRCVLVAQGHQGVSRLKGTGAPVLPDLFALPGFLEESAGLGKHL